MRRAVVAAFQRALAAFVLVVGVSAFWWLLHWDANQCTAGKSCLSPPEDLSVHPWSPWDVLVLVGLAAAALGMALLLYKRRARLRSAAARVEEEYVPGVRVRS